MEGDELNLDVIKAYMNDIAAAKTNVVDDESDNEMDEEDGNRTTILQ